ncbi:hypothetical protein OEG84_07910 [Hoeflea sp. G2-23]|uniref:Uncharacterized protein n=1 Tax=Hoeflea algicola TaxID=2983763 RepID=A0ABT3Z789_9HYPH|nr:hypothetical protein [Hoeflea algicola]MCY0147641.1 hypothetical protein [Hoeflea algicola]
MLFLQTFFLIAVAFALGCLAGCWLKRTMGKGAQSRSGAAAAVTHEGAARTSTASELAAPRPHYEPESTPQPASALGTGAASVTDTSSKDAGISEKAPSGPDKPVAMSKTRAAKAASKAPTAVKRKPAKATSVGPAKAKTDKPPAKSSSAKPTDVQAASAAPAEATAKAKATKSAVAKPKSAKPAATKAAAAKPAKAETALAKPAKVKPANAKAGKVKPVAAVVPDNLKQVKGIGPQNEAKLNGIGVNSFAQIAAWTKKEQADIGERLAFPGRIEREDWVGQAKVLARGGQTDFAKRVAKGEVASSAAATPKRGGKKPG